MDGYGDRANFYARDVTYGRGITDSVLMNWLRRMPVVVRISKQLEQFISHYFLYLEQPTEELELIVTEMMYSRLWRGWKHMILFQIFQKYIQSLLE